ncbi:MAG: class I adenylate-forming enzyme family protein [Eggerthellales bacterium]|nr:class I adenylate-forming enzyme family protein [Eggerthellales bacterium]
MDLDSRFKLSSVVECVAAHAAENPEKLALADARMSLTYGQAWDCIVGFASYLRRDLPRGTFVVMECNQSVQYMIAMLAMHYAGIVPVPLERNVAVARQLEIIAETDAKLYIAEKEADPAAGVPSLDIRTVCDFAGQEPCGDLAFPQGTDMAEILFSTGTTGKSKGIMLSHRNNMAIAENVVRGLQMGDDNVEVIPMPTSHSHGLRRTYSNLVNGSSVVFCDGVVAIKRMFNLMDEYHATAMDLAPSMLSIIFRLSKDRLGDYADKLDYVQLGSAPLAEDDKLHLARLLPKTRLYNFYGSTEAGCSCLLEFASMSGKRNCIGRPTTNANFVVVDDDRKPIQSSPDNLGLLASSGDINMMGYYKAPELTAEAMADGFIYTKDLGYIGEDGLVYMLGRKDDVINFGGVKISPEEVESAVGKSPIVKDCALIPVTDPISGQVPKLYISLEEGAEYDAKEFRKFLQVAIDANKQPQSVEVLPEIPRTFNGKIKRKELMNR